MTYKPTARRDDLPPTDDEIEISPGTLAQAPIRVKETALPVLRDIHTQALKFEQVVAGAQVRLSALRLAANELQGEYEIMLEERAGLVKNIAGAEYELEVSRSRMVELDAYVRAHWWREGDSMQGHIEEHGRRAFLADPARLPTWILDWNVALGELNKRIAAFEKQHGVGEK